MWVRGGTSSKSEDGRREKILERLQEFQGTVFPRYWYGKGGLQGCLCIDKEPSARNSAGCEGVSQEFLGRTVPGECLELGTEHVSFLPAMHQITRLISFFLSFFTFFYLKAAAERELEAACSEFCCLLPTILIIKRCYRFPSD